MFNIWSLFALGCVVRVIFNLWGKKSIKYVTYNEGPDVLFLSIFKQHILDNTSIETPPQIYVSKYTVLISVPCCHGNTAASNLHVYMTAKSGEHNCVYLGVSFFGCLFCFLFSLPMDSVGSSLDSHSQNVECGCERNL